MPAQFPSGGSVKAERFAMSPAPQHWHENMDRIIGTSIAVHKRFVNSKTVSATLKAHPQQNG